MDTPSKYLKNRLTTLKVLSGQKHRSFRKYKKLIPIYEEAIKILKEAETSKEVSNCKHTNGCIIDGIKQCRNCGKLL